MLPRILGGTPIEARKSKTATPIASQQEVRKSVRDPLPLAQDNKITRGTRLNLIGAVAGSDGLVRVGLGGRAGGSRFDSGHVCLRRLNCFFLGLAGFV